MLDSVNPRNAADQLDKAISDTDDNYGLPQSFSNFNFAYAYNKIIDVYEGRRRDNAWYGFMADAAEPLVRASINADKSLINYLDSFPSSHYSDSEKRNKYMESSQIDSILDKFEKNDQYLMENIIDGIDLPDRPNENDYDGEEEFSKAEREYEEKVQKLEDEQERYTRDNYLPYALDMKIIEELRRQLAEKPIEIKSWMKDTNITYFSPNQTVDEPVAAE